MFIIYR